MNGGLRARAVGILTLGLPLFLLSFPRAASPWTAAASFALILLALLLVDRVLRQITTPTVAGCAVFLLLYGTFLYGYATHEAWRIEPAVAVTLSALVLVLWWDGGGRLSPRRSGALGLAIGLAAAIRASSAALILLPAATFVPSIRLRPLETLRSSVATLAGFGLGLLPGLSAAGLPHADPASVLETLFSPRHGLLYWNPVLWGGFFGYVPLFRRDHRRALPPFLALAAILCLRGDDAAGARFFAGGRFDAGLPLLALGLAGGLAGLVRAAAWRPGWILVAAGAVLTVWNLLFMEQYRKDRIPRDETVSFARVTENNAGLLAGFVGSPLAWPANWIFAWRHGLPAARYDSLVGKSLFDRLGGRIDLGDDRVDPTYLGEGWGSKRPCEGGVCRGVEETARLFAPFARAETIDLTVRAAGSGTLSIDVNGKRVAELPVTGSLMDLRVRVPAARWRAGLNEIVLTCTPPAKAAVRRLVFSRLGAAS